MSKRALRIAVTGAAGRIGYSLLFRIASGQMLGPDQPVRLQLLEIPDPKAQKALQGVALELEDCAFPLLHGVSMGAGARDAFRDADIAILVGSRPRGPGMERKDLLQANGAIFVEQGRALNEVASRSVKVLVVGNPANTNALIAMHSAPDLPRTSFSSMMRLDHNRAKAQLAGWLGVPVATIRRVTVWGNHSATQVPDLSNALADRGSNVTRNDAWWRNQFVPTIQKRGAEIIAMSGLSSAASAAVAATDHMRDWVLGTPEGDWVSMGIPSDGSYGIPEGIMFGHPVACSGGDYSIVPDLAVDPGVRVYIERTHQELIEERGEIEHLLRPI